MCGRFALSHTHLQELFQAWGVTFPEQATFEPHFNISPGQKHWILFKHEGVLLALRSAWGVSPSWMKPGQLLFNAKIETVLEKQTFKKAFQVNRCVVPINGFYEWMKQGQVKQPYFFHRMNEEVFFLAGLYYRFGDRVCFVVMTTKAHQWMQPFHHRMPIILTTDTFQRWLEATAVLERESFMEMDTRLLERKVSTRVNHTGVDDPQCMEPLVEKPLRS